MQLGKACQLSIIIIIIIPARYLSVVMKELTRGAATDIEYYSKSMRSITQAVHRVVEKPRCSDEIGEKPNKLSAMSPKNLEAVIVH